MSEAFGDRVRSEELLLQESVTGRLRYSNMTSCGETGPCRGPYIPPLFFFFFLLSFSLALFFFFTADGLIREEEVLRSCVTEREGKDGGLKKR